MILSGTTSRRFLSEAQRRELLQLLADRPHLTAGQVAKIFESRTGRRLASVSIKRAKAEGFRSIGSDYRRRHLTEEERSILERICHRAAPAYHPSEIARRFAELAGRPIHRTSVGRYLARHFDDFQARPRCQREAVIR